MDLDIEIRWYAQLREQRGLAAENLATSATTVAELYDELKARHELALDRADLRVAVNDSFVDWPQTISAGDRIVFIPPVAGG